MTARGSLMTQMKVATIAALLLIPILALGQTAPASLSFDVASIKPAEPITAAIAAGRLHVGMTVKGNTVDIGFMSLAELIPMAFKLKQYQVSGPDWLASQRFDILAKMPGGATQDQVPEMLQALLAE